MKTKILLSLFSVIFGFSVIGCSKDNIAPPKQPKNTSAASSSTEANTGNQNSSHTCGSGHYGNGEN
jgi:hypothetical protein